MANTFTVPATATATGTMTAVWEYNGFPADTSTLYMTTLDGEEKVFDYGFTGGLTPYNVPDGYAVSVLNSIPTATFTITRHGGWYKDPILWRFESKNSLDGVVTFKDTTTISDIGNYSDLQVDHVDQAIDLLLGQFSESDKLQALLSSYIGQLQSFENASYSLIAARNVNVATGDRLDGLGQIVGEERQGRTDDVYRYRIKARLAANKSSGTAENIITVLQLLQQLDTPNDILIDEYFPKTIYVRIKDKALTTTEVKSFLPILNIARSAGTDLHCIFTDVEASDEDLFRFSDSYGSNETGSSHGFNTGTWAGEEPE